MAKFDFSKNILAFLIKNFYQILKSKQKFYNTDKKDCAYSCLPFQDISVKVYIVVNYGSPLKFGICPVFGG